MTDPRYIHVREANRPKNQKLWFRKRHGFKARLKRFHEKIERDIEAFRIKHTAPRVYGPGEVQKVRISYMQELDREINRKLIFG